jgi:NADH dehydrogenase FAD-containing subunit
MNTNSTVIVGGGFAGLFTALHLRHRRYKNPVILIDAQTQFVFKPLLYEYLSAEMQEDQVTPTYAELLQGSDISFVPETVTQINLQQRMVTLASGLHYNYEYLVLAVGSVQGYFGVEGAQRYGFAFRTRTDALRLRQHLQDCLQKATQTSDPIQRQQLLTIAIVGAGPTGVEMSATLADLLPDWYRQLGGNTQNIRIVLINHGQDILEGDINTDLREIALQTLKEKAIPVELMLGVKVKSVAPDRIDYQTQDQTQESLMSATAIWTTGTAPNPLIEAMSLPAGCLDRHGQLIVTPTLQLPTFSEVFAAGDCAVVQPDPLPLIAQVAYQQGAGIAHNLLALSRGKLPQPVRVKLRGTLMKLGIRNGIANLFNKVQIDGQVGDLIRNATYLEMLPTPIHNFKATAEWLNEEIFNRYSSVPSKTTDSVTTDSVSKPSSRTKVWVGGLFIAAALSLGLFAVWRSQQPSQLTPQQTKSQQ